ncbi:MAG: zinc-binding alcohol dehydrogenase family protein [Mesorhizobium sp.]|uniref:zinc-binding alcohol dehydrogenase family protein n=1 Tax=unclassified Mesorhizobium TaxID=325217 RepID=UPI000FCB9D38|nr:MULTISPECIES: zinc-binding alcohol dehydrogenase family protein [unclassified Mesorhizobium]RUX48059.1 zinc-binding alcohol dehydrogenase family protein [Mesorhizobium sp. M4A.F.Ca.ET.050.02.1.1]RVD39808.1 zinc-binding alcohol dehydrogenase family protein [Mesorhizobium sp. M4A.F.Ca.ET.020.02.1.1]RWC22043.1 MAG: zinc-binding alcohol dehydrogenase family protein [Mesorhizobium sp.]RWD04574.1 MAG: zinc-binding alcohol dehydrogenase family protein [Mesorhizobium sp.]RWD28854.1 MAG: zinc-bindin
MKALVCRKPGELIFEDRPAPGPPGAGWALVSISHVGICGTDYHIFEGKHPYLAYPRVMGHELSGTVTAVGEGVTIEVGERVVVNPYFACDKCIACRHGKPNCCVSIEVLGVHRDGGMCEELLVPAGNLYPVAGLPLVHAAAVEFLAIGAHAVRRSELAAGAHTLVVGAGPIGLGTALFARIAGQAVTLMDTSTERLDFAESQLGFPVIDGASVSPVKLVRERTDGDCFDLVFDATGSKASIQAAFGYVAHGGALVMVSVIKDQISFSDPEFHKREMMLIGSRNALRADFDHVMAAMHDGAIPVDKLTTHHTTVQNSPRDISHWANQKSGLIKAVIAF